MVTKTFSVFKFNSFPIVHLLPSFYTQLKIKDFFIIVWFPTLFVIFINQILHFTPQIRVLTLKLHYNSSTLIMIFMVVSKLHAKTVPFFPVSLPISIFCKLAPTFSCVRRGWRNPRNSLFENITKRIFIINLLFFGGFYSWLYICSQILIYFWGFHNLGALYLLSDFDSTRLRD